MKVPDFLLELARLTRKCPYCTSHSTVIEIMFDSWSGWFFIYACPSCHHKWKVPQP